MINREKTQKIFETTDHNPNKYNLQNIWKVDKQETSLVSKRGEKT